MHVEFSWPQDLILGIPQVDSEHIAIIAQIEILRTLISGEAPESDFRDIAPIVKKISYHHFLHEENMMMKYSCSDFDEHKKEHKKFLNQITRLIGTFDCNPTDTIQRFYDVCGNWYINHIRTYDTTMAMYIKSHMVSPE